MEIRFQNEFKFSFLFFFFFLTDVAKKLLIANVITQQLNANYSRDSSLFDDDDISAFYHCKSKKNQK